MIAILKKLQKLKKLKKLKKRPMRNIKIKNYAKRKLGKGGKV
jgi:hypothetical protein|tara:strand:+ start:357 stop:482 length:126 start_codon:yes stop_codon:yes gene_type:complete